MQVNISATARKRAEAALVTLKTQDLIDKLQKASLSQINTYVDNNVTNIASARTLLKKMLAVMSYLLNKG